MVGQLIRTDLLSCDARQIEPLPLPPLSTNAPERKRLTMKCAKRAGRKMAQDEGERERERERAGMNEGWDKKEISGEGNFKKLTPTDCMGRTTGAASARGRGRSSNV